MPNPNIKCSFCNYGVDKATSIVAGPNNIGICDACIGVCVQLMYEGGHLCLEKMVGEAGAVPLLCYSDMLSSGATLNDLLKEISSPAVKRAALDVKLRAVHSRKSKLNDDIHDLNRDVRLAEQEEEAITAALAKLPAPKGD
ncbi:MAG: ClpX C4-type zinc finger protein [Patescibacteria group bacterium]